MSESRADLIERFNRLYYHGPDGRPLWEQITWLGVRILKCPMDLWIYQEILSRTRPEVIVETGVFAGGSSLYLASLCDLLGQGQVLACDITLEGVSERVKAHPRITFLEGSSTASEMVAQVTELCHGKRTMVILDSDHAYAHVLKELRCYAPLVTPGCYLVCEDTNVNSHPSFPDHGPGPFEAVQEFLRDTPGWEMDRQCERLLVTFNPSGYLLRLEE
jgi:cephalosporin hydroxylase